MPPKPSRNSADRPSRAALWVRAAVREALRDVWALLMPVYCAGCELPDRALCAACARELVADPRVQSTPRHLRVFVALDYEGTARRVLLAFKDQQRTDLALVLARCLMPALHAALARAAAPAVAAAAGDVRVSAQIVAVPPSRAAFRRRGYHPMAVVLRAAGIRHSRVLRVVKATGQQKTLTAQQRARNAQGAFVATRWLGDEHFIVVDDILTTGATIDEATRAIVEAGGRVIAAATIGFTPRRLPVRDFVSIEG